MKKIIIFIILCFIAMPVYAQQAVVNDIALKQADITAQNATISNQQATATSANASIAAAQAQIALDNTAIATDTALNNAYIASTAQNTSAWNFAYDAQLEAAGCRWATCFPVVFPNANLAAISAQINITCPVTEASVNWNNWPSYSGIHGSTAQTWSSFYCGQGPAS
jgi:hypothetical protein